MLAKSKQAKVKCSNPFIRIILILSPQHACPTFLTSTVLSMFLRAFDGLPPLLIGATAGTDAFSLLSLLKNVLYGISITLSLAFSYLYITNTRASIHQWISVPALLFFYPDAEEAHRSGTSFLKYLYASSLHPHERGSLDALDNLIIRDRFRAYPAKPHCHVCGHRQTWRNP